MFDVVGIGMSVLDTLIRTDAHLGTGGGAFCRAD